MATKKSKSKKQALKRIPMAAPMMIDPRKELLAKVAGSIAAGLVTSPSPSIATPSTMAMAAVDIAEAILKQACIPSVESESSSPTGDAAVGAAS